MPAKGKSNDSRKSQRVDDTDDGDSDEEALALDEFVGAASPSVDTSLWTRTAGGVTTLMVRNIPSNYSQDMLLEEWPLERWKFDFLYLPVKIMKKRNLGFAFVNFVTPSAAADFYLAWHRKRLPLFNDGKRNLDVTPAHIQGRMGNLLQIMRNKNFRIRNDTYKPAIFEQGQRICISDFVQRLYL